MSDLTVDVDELVIGMVNRLPEKGDVFNPGEMAKWLEDIALVLMIAYPDQKPKPRQRRKNAVTSATPAANVGGDEP